jgi:hypothetical protein
MKKIALMLPLMLLPLLARAEDAPREHFIDQVTRCAAWFGLSDLTGKASSGSGPREVTSFNTALGRLFGGDIDRLSQHYNAALDQIITDAASAPGNDEQRLQGIAGRYEPVCRRLYRTLDENMAKWAP